MHLPSIRATMSAMLSLQAIHASPLAARAAQPTPCFSSYPSFLTQTEANRGDPLLLHVDAFGSEPLIDNRNVQLRTDPTNFRVQIAVIDPVSPVLALELPRAGVIESYGTYGALGPLAGLRNVSTVRTGPSAGGMQDLIFRNNTPSVAAEFKRTYDQWQFVDLSNDGTYGLYSEAVTEGFVNGFIACPVGGAENGTVSNSAYWQINYYEYQSEPGDIGSCVFVGLQTTYAPQLGT